MAYLPKNLPLVYEETRRRNGEVSHALPPCPAVNITQVKTIINNCLLTQMLLSHDQLILDKYTSDYCEENQSSVGTSNGKVHDLGYMTTMRRAIFVTCTPGRMCSQISRGNRRTICHLAVYTTDSYWRICQIHQALERGLSKVVDEVTLEQESLPVYSGFPCNHYSTIAPHSSIALIRHHNMTSPIFQLMNSSPTSFCLTIKQ